MDSFGLKFFLDHQLDYFIKYKYLLFLNLANSLNISFGGFNEDTSLNGLTTRFRIYLTKENRKLLYIDIPPLDEKKNIKLKRILNCYSFWLTYCIELSNELQKSFEVILNASDWGIDKILSMTSVDIDNLIPDEYSMFQSKELPKLKAWEKFEDFQHDWSHRKSKMFWRGSTTGHDIRSTRSLSELQRIRICLKYLDINSFDLKVTNIVQNYLPKQIINQWLVMSGIKGKRVSEEIFSKYKYHPDIPGNNKSCGSWGVIKKHVRGNLIFKPDHESKMFYDQYMYPWEHYIPVENDFSDLEKQFMWAECNELKASTIAWNGYCQSVSLLKEIKPIFLKKVKNKISII
tara:strand:- start:848 stop:1885 length:1038 start_codon:yes stop_codon:yes gene_type:complete